MPLYGGISGMMEPLIVEENVVDESVDLPIQNNMVLKLI